MKYKCIHFSPWLCKRPGKSYRTRLKEFLAAHRAGSGMFRLLKVSWAVFRSPAAVSSLEPRFRVEGLGFSV